MLIVLCVPIEIIVLSLPQWILGNVACKLWKFIIQFNMISSIFIMLIMNCERFMAIVYPMQLKVSHQISC